MFVAIYIEKKKYMVEDSSNLLESCLRLGFDIPYFCWHPALGSVGSCRQCVVKQYCNSNSNISRDSLIVSCMTKVLSGMSISLVDKEAKEFRKGILELLMINHPHDCPVCEEGGNCHLQDMTMMTGQVYRRYRFAKRTHHNQYLGPLINHEMNRCITCYRCVRYYADYAGGNDLGVFGVHDNIYFGRIKDGMLQSEFSGNLIEICPTGVFTDKTQSKNYTRKWDALFSPSVCHQCSVGCNIILGERYGRLCRVENRYNKNINGYFLCDRGRFGCDYVNLDNRPKNPLKRKNNKSLMILDKDKAIQDIVNELKSSHKIIGIGSPRASMESNFALLKLVGIDNFYTGVSSLEQERLLLILEILCSSGIHVPSLYEIESYDTILILGEDITQTAARVALSVRQAVQGAISSPILNNQGVFKWHAAAVINSTQNCKNSLFITGIDKTKLDDVAILTYYDAVQNQARFGFAIAHAIDNTAPAVQDLNCELNDKVNIVVKQLIKSRKSLIITGVGSGSKELIAAAANIARALKNRGSEVGITCIVSDVNSIGLSMIGGKKSLNDALVNICCSNTSLISVIILENDLYRNASSYQVNKALENVKFLVVLDHQYNLIQEKANVVLSTATFAESNGTVVNYEGRAQRFFKVLNNLNYDSNHCVLESWKWLYLIDDLYRNCARPLESLHIDHVIDDIVNFFPKLLGIKEAAPDASFRVYGRKLSRAPYRYSGRTSMYTNINVHEPCVSYDDETMFTFSMEGYHSMYSAHTQTPFSWAPGWNSPQLWNNKYCQNKKNIHNSHLFQDNSKVFLLRNNNGVILDWYKDIPEPFNSNINNSNTWIIAPYWHLFGSELMSQKIKCIQDCMVQTYMMMNVNDAKQLDIKQDTLLQFSCANKNFCLPVKFSENLPKGHIGLPMGFPNVPVFISGMYVYGIKCKR